MTIVCATDFSPSGRQALLVASALAARTRDGLQVLYALGDLPDFGKEDVDDAVALAKRHGAQAEGIAREGMPGEVIPEVCKERDAWLLVVGRRAREQEDHLLGAVASHLLRRSHCPWLVATDPQPFADWLSGKRPLAVMVASDLSPTSTEALRFVKRLASAGEISLRVAHVAWPPEAHRRAHASGPQALDSLRADVEASIRAELEAQVREGLGDTPCTIDLSMSWGRPDGEILRLAREAQADVVVVGSRHKTWRERFTTPAVAAGAVRNADIATIVVPSRE
mgnify:CR=1 FL=1